jgi:outer membrane receptor for ferrienterochelin and colicins
MLVLNPHTRFRLLVLLTAAVWGSATAAAQDVSPKNAAKDLAKTTTKDTAKSTGRDTTSLKTTTTSEVVVTATRSEKELENVPIPVTVIGKKQIERQGAMRLDEVLAEQTGLMISHDHGTGIQMQGFDPAYTLILIDGEPLIGRTAGTLELTRFAVANIERIEIVKGPSSSLFGSEALAGAVNIITRQAEEPFSAKLNTRYGTLNTLDLNAFLETKQDKFSGSVMLNRNSSGGFSLNPESQTTTAPRFSNYTLNPKLNYQLSERGALSLSGRLLSEESNGTYLSSQRLIDSRQNLLDWNIASTLKQKFFSSAKTEFRFYASQYRNDFTDRFRDTNQTFFSGNFNQRMMKGENQADLPLSSTNLLTLGGGYIRETVVADRVEGGERQMSTMYVFMQDDWQLAKPLNLLASFRYDRNSDFGAQLSPRVALMLKPVSQITFRASVGSGFKAPTFQQLFLDFTNAAAGYSVFGSSNVQSSLNRLQQGGEIRSVLLDISNASAIRAESSVAFNVGVDVTPMNALTLKVNYFRNNVSGLIATQPIAIKANGQSVFSYFNLNSVMLAGIEGDVILKPIKSITLSSGYQYVQALDNAVLTRLQNGTISRNTGTVLEPRIERVTRADYGGLFDRSAHQLTLKCFYDNPERGVNGSLRGVLRSRYGFADRNANSILDADNEFAPGYAIWDITLNKSITEKLKVQAGVDNLFDQKDIRYTPFLPGRIFFAGLRWEN